MITDVIVGMVNNIKILNKYQKLLSIYSTEIINVSTLSTYTIINISTEIKGWGSASEIWLSNKCAADMLR